LSPPWWCSNACRAGTPGEKTHDHVQAYSKALGFQGLVDLVNRDIVREGDGEALNSEWRAAMPQFSNKNHTNYFVLGHNLLTGMIDFILYSFMCYNL